MADDPSDWDDGNLPSEKATEINKQRAKTYGSPIVNMGGFAIMASFVFGVEATPQQCALYETLKKCVREHNAGYDPDYVDNLDDACGWSNVLYIVKEASRASQ